MADWYKLASITTAGSAGSATGDSGKVSVDYDTRKPIPHGFITGVFIDFTSQPSTCDVSIFMIMPNGSQFTYLVTTNTNTDGYYPVKHYSYNNAGAVNSSDLIYPETANGTFQVTVAQGDAITNGVAVWVAIE